MSLKTLSMTATLMVAIGGLLTMLSGCVGVVDPGYPGGAVYVQPEVGVFGDFGWGHDRDAGRRGWESRGGGHGGFHGGHHR